MSDKELTLLSFQWAVESLEAILGLPGSEIVRDATIHRFDVTYDLALRMIQRHLIRAGNAYIGSPTAREIIREAAKVGLIADADAWFDCQEARLLSSDYPIPEQVYETARTFSRPARRLLGQLQEQNKIGDQAGSDQAAVE